MAAPLTFPLRLSSPSGLGVSFNANGSLQQITHHDVLLNLFPGNEIEGGPANLYLRANGRVTPLLGPRSPSTLRLENDVVVFSGRCGGIEYVASIRLAASMPAWYWHLSLRNAGNEPLAVDSFYVQDVGLTSYWSARNNEYYVSQYVDHTPLEHRGRGVVVASRQNQALGGRHPWCVTGSLARGTSFATDALQVFGLSQRARREPTGIVNGLPGERHQHEHSMVAIQDEVTRLEPGGRIAKGFFVGFIPHHAQATSTADLEFVDKILAQSEAGTPSAPASPSPDASSHRSLFSHPAVLEALDLTDAELRAAFGEPREVERDEDGRLLSFFARERSHVVTRAKELRVLRPHGHILRTCAKLTPDESALTSTAWMSGVFHSLVTQGHVGINRLVSTTRSYLGLFQSHGMRLFAEIGDQWVLLDLPSAFEMSPGGCRWIYKHAGGVIEVESIAKSAVLYLRAAVTAGPATRFLFSTHVAVGGDDGQAPVPLRWSRTDTGAVVRTIPDTDLGSRFPEGGFALQAMKETRIGHIGGDEMLFADGQSRGLPYLCIVSEPSTFAGFKIIGQLLDLEPGEDLQPEPFWNDMISGLRINAPDGSRLGADACRLAEMLPWFAHNALVHYLSPRGLEQFSGGGWGSRDVTQGPVEMLLSIGQTAPTRDLLTRVFKQQNVDGDWPQWFMFFDRERNIRPADSHGDIVFWPILALARYLLASGDNAFLEERIPFFHPEGDARAQREPLLVHVDRALGLIERRVIPGTRLAAYGHGDWNDSLQPADPAMRERLCSSWTVTLHYQTLQALAGALGRLGHVDRSIKLLEQSAHVLEDFQNLLVVDEVIAGYAYFHEDGRTDYLLHPRDKASGVKYSALPMIHALGNGMLTEEQAEHHLGLIDQHLLAPDGIRLFDRPMPYRGGAMKFFQRAETATFFGREIGLMYTHAHLRFVEALAHYGDADTFFDQLCRAIPINLRARIPTATLRQSNCYYSSSDALFKDRYEALEDYGKAMNGEIAYEGGWRIYSSGAGISLALILRSLLGLRREEAKLILDPVLPRDLDGLRIEIDLFGRPFEITYRVGEEGCGVNKLMLNGEPLPFDREANAYRVGGAEVEMGLLRSRMKETTNLLEVTIG